MVRALLVASLVAASCYSPKIADCEIGCATDSTSPACPAGLVCGAQGRCVAETATTCTADAGARDAATDAAKDAGSTCPQPPTGASTGMGSATCANRAFDNPTPPCVAVCGPAFANMDANGYVSGPWTIAQHITPAEETVLQAHAGPGTWIGLHRNPQASGGFAWTDMSALGSAAADLHWAPGQPGSDVGGEPCVEVTSSGWVTASCGGSGSGSGSALPFFVQAAAQ